MMGMVNDPLEPNFHHVPDCLFRVLLFSAFPFCSTVVVVALHVFTETKTHRIIENRKNKTRLARAGKV